MFVRYGDMDESGDENGSSPLTISDTRTKSDLHKISNILHLCIPSIPLMLQEQYLKTPLRPHLSSESNPGIPSCQKPCRHFPITHHAPPHPSAS
jgi:hypothetical protein